MTALKSRSALLAGLALAMWPASAAPQSGDPLTLPDALQLAGAAGDGAPSENPRIVGPREEAAVAEALVEQAGLRPNPEVSFEVENIAGTGAFSGLQATEFTLAASLPIERGGKRMKLSLPLNSASG